MAPLNGCKACSEVPDIMHVQYWPVYIFGALRSLLTKQAHMHNSLHLHLVTGFVSWAFFFSETICALVQLAEAKRARKSEQEKDKRKQRQELERIKEAEAQKAHEAALAAIEGRSASELIKAVKPSNADSSRSVQASYLALSFLHKQLFCLGGRGPEGA